MRKKKKNDGGIIDRLSFPTEFNNVKELKLNIIVLFLTCLAFFITSTIVISFNLILFTKVLLVGTIAYELILFYLLFEYTKKFIMVNIKGSGRTAVNLLTYLIFGGLLLITALNLIYTMATVAPTSEDKFISLSVALLIIVLPTFFWHEFVQLFDKSYFKYLKFIVLSGLIIGLFFNPVLAEGNETINATQQGVFNWFSQGIDFFSSASNMFNSFKSTIEGTLSLDPWTSQMVMIILILILAFLLFKFLSLVIKWVVVGLIIWVVAQLFFL